MMVFKLKYQAAILIAFVCIGSPVLGHSPPGAKTVAGKRSEADREKLQGKWHILSITMQGKVIKKEDHRGEWKETFDKEVTIQGDRFSHAMASEAKIKLDDTRTPKQITIQDKEGKLTFRGIYAIDGDTMTICINGDGTDVRRPEEFVSREGTPLLLIALKKSPAKK